MPKSKINITLFSLFLFSILGLKGQLIEDLGTIQGMVTDTAGKGIANAKIQASNARFFVFTDSAGFYNLKTKASPQVFVSFSHLSFLPNGKVTAVKKDSVSILNMQLKPLYHSTGKIEVKRKAKKKEIGKTEIKGEILEDITSASGDAMAAIQQQAGVQANNELSSAYSVRGGNYDENLIYVNGIEIYRPFLIRSGQQEGLSFVNSDMVKSLSFSAGGFDAIYGDKMSSVLDITYRTPKKFAAGINMSLLGANAFVQDTVGSRFTYLMGARYKTNSYLLGTLDTQGEYRPQFFDYQTIFTYQANKKLKFSFLGNVSSNRYEFVPVSRQTKFGGLNQAFQLNLGLAGNEVNRFDAYFGAISAEYIVSDSTKLQFNASAFNTNEQETYDIAGAYELGELETNIAADNLGEVTEIIGTGSFLDHARNYLYATILNMGHSGKHLWKDHKLQWGLSYQEEHFEDDLLEWRYSDSADYSLPVGGDDAITIEEYRKTGSNLSTFRTNAYLQNNWQLMKADSVNKKEMNLNTGARLNYWSYSKQWLVSPRLALQYTPGRTETDSLGKSHQYTYRFSWGYYYQPPFYRELRNLNGEIMPDVRAQKSIHYVAGMDYDFMWNKTPFTWRTEVFYKHLDDLIPFEMENVKLRYYGVNSGSGYAAGFETRINGEFVKDLESWFSFSLLKTEETIENFNYTQYYNNSGEQVIPGFTADEVIVDSLSFAKGAMPRPTDQRFSFKLFFQDKMPKFPAFKVHLNFVYASGLPFGPSGSVSARNAFRIPAYRRVDIGFTYDIVEDGQLRKGKELVDMPEKHFLRIFKDFWIRAEVFNMLDISNTVSYFWISDIHNRQYAVPNFLTQRLINVRIAGKF